MISVVRTEECDCGITLYFNSSKELSQFARAAWEKYKSLGTRSGINMSLQIHNFGHDSKYNPLSFHTDGKPDRIYGDVFRHIHVRYRDPPTEADWENLYRHMNDKKRGIELRRDIPHRKVQRDFDTLEDIENAPLPDHVVEYMKDNGLA